MVCRTTKALLALAVGALTLTSCYNDNAEDLYGVSNCDTSAVTFSQDVSIILENSCTGCHGNIAPVAGLNLKGHANASAAGLDGSIMDRVSRPASDHLAMPPGGPLSDCDIDKLRIWIDQGALNN